MLRKKFSKTVSGLLAVAMMLSVLPVGWMGNIVYASPENVEIANGNFEEGVPGWTVESSSNVLALSDTEVHGGNNSLKMVDTGGGEAPIISSEMIPVSEGDIVSASCYANVSAYVGSAYVDAVFSVWYCDENGNRIASGQAYGPDILGNSGWTQYSTGDIPVPSQIGATDVAGVCVTFYGAGGGECLAYFDDVQVTVNSEETPLNNGDFEGGVPGWTAEDGPGVLALSDTKAHGGNNSLKMVDIGEGEAPVINSEVIPVSEGDVVSVSCYADVSAYAGSAYVDAVFSVWYCDENGNRASQAYGFDIPANGGWTQYSTGDITVPAGKDNICVTFYGAGGGECLAYFDDVQVTVDYADPGEEPEARTAISNPDFESAVEDEGVIPDWQMDDGATDENYQLVTEESYNESTSLKMIDPGSGSSPWLYSSLVDAAPGDTVTLTAYVKVETGTAELAIIYVDGNGNPVSSYENIDITPCGWSQKTVTGTVPEGAVSVKAFIWSGNAAATTAYFDDVSFSFGPALTAQTILSADCSNLTVMIGQGWTIDPPSDGVFSTDSTHSTGATTPDMEVPDGQMLFYTDSTSGDGAIGAVKMVDRVNVIGEQPWRLDLDMDIENLMNVTSPDGISGFSIVVDIGREGRVYRVNFDSDGKIRALTDGGLKERAVDFHLHDGQIHHWSLQGDKTGRLDVLCDGEIVASFASAYKDGSWNQEYGVQFISFNSGIDSGSIEVYFDNIELMVYTENPGAGVTAGTPANLGEAVIGNGLFLYSVIEENPATGKDELYTVSTGSTTNSSIFYTLDPSTGEVLFSQQIPGTVHNYGIVKGSDGNIYFGGTDTGKLYRYTPGAGGQGTITDLGENPSSTWIWDLVASDDGKIYGSTSQQDGGSEGARVFEYNIASGDFTDLGIVKAGALNARGLGIVGDYLYVGVGSPDLLVRIDRNNPSDKLEISIPAMNGQPGTGVADRMCGHVWSYNGKLFVRNNAMKLFVLDGDTLEGVTTLSFEQAISSPSPYNGNIIYFKSKCRIWQYDCSTNTASEVEDSPYLPGAASNALSWFTSTEEGRQLLAITDDAGGLTIYDPLENTAEKIYLDIPPQAVDIQSLEKGPDGNLYIGGYQYGSSVFDPDSGNVLYTASRMDQPEGIGFLNGKVYFGTYGSARIFAYNPDEDFFYEDDSSINPGLVYDIGSDQDRPFAITSGGNKLFVGTIPDYGKLGGALTVYDEQSGVWSEYGNLINKQSITGLAYKDGLVYGGTSVAGGIGKTSEADQAVIFVWDAESKELVDTYTIHIPGLKATYEQTERTTPVMIGSLTFGKDGLLWAAVDGALVALDPDTMEVVKYRILVSNMNYDTDSAWRPYYLRWGADGLLYTTIGRRVTAFDTQTMGYDTLTGYAGLTTLGNDGNLYYAEGSNLMMVPLARTEELEEAYQIGSAANAAQDAIDLLPGSYNLTLADKSDVEAAQRLVEAAVSAGASLEDIGNLSKLEDCKTVIEQLSGEPVDPSEPGDSDEDEPSSPVVPITKGDTTTYTIKTENFGSDESRKVIVGKSDINAAIRESLAVAAKSKTKAVVEVKVDSTEKTQKTQVSVPVASLRKIAKSGVSDFVVSSGIAAITFSADALSSIAAQTSEDTIKIVAGIADTSSLSDEIKAKIGSAVVYEFSVIAGATPVSSFGGGKVKVTIPYTLKEGETADTIVVWYIGSGGTLQKVEGARYDSAAKSVIFETDHFSTYAIASLSEGSSDTSPNPSSGADGDQQPVPDTGDHGTSAVLPFVVILCAGLAVFCKRKAQESKK